MSTEAKASDRELSLAVAKILWPEYAWKNEGGMVYRREILPDIGMMAIHIQFDYRTDDALGKMVVELAKRSKVGENFVAIFAGLIGEDPHRALAEKLLEVTNEPRT